MRLREIGADVDAKVLSSGGLTAYPAMEKSGTLGYA